MVASVYHALSALSSFAASVGRETNLCYDMKNKNISEMKNKLKHIWTKIPDDMSPFLNQKFFFYFQRTMNEFQRIYLKTFHVLSLV